MYYLLLMTLFVLLYFVFVKILSSIVKGCIMAFAVALFIWLATLVYQSWFSPVSIFGLFELYKFELRNVSPYVLAMFNK